MRAFTASRDDGRSDRQVLVDLAAKLQPGDLLSYEEMLGALREGTDREITIQTVRGSVPGANRTLVREHTIALVTVRGAGYRIAEPDEWFSLVNGRRRRAHRQTRKGLEVAVHAPRGRMSTDTLRRLDGMQLQLARVEQALVHVAARTVRHENLIADLQQRVEHLEGDKPGTVDGSAEEDAG